MDGAVLILLHLYGCELNPPQTIIEREFPSSWDARLLFNR